MQCYNTRQQHHRRFSLNDTKKLRKERDKEEGREFGGKKKKWSFDYCQAVLAIMRYHIINGNKIHAGSSHNHSHSPHTGFSWNPLAHTDSNRSLVLEDSSQEKLAKRCEEVFRLTQKKKKKKKKRRDQKKKKKKKTFF
ncbi:hypothetical protein RFI_24757 [Reticulomyxa filosa]|uniref:Uncharacterized protein n=1 Tax=Reticulomyxa filosa TaxID=46433 RepID=X6MFE3_RETFI|nr:hypothetical protein RFI_24757 [Reticulomyxa filosa]|eukprot:ETO12619.1 hypothetical protein RFI_24757 [Reticulomyxa filosa]